MEIALRNGTLSTEAAQDSYLSFTFESAGTTLELVKNGSPADISLQISTDGGFTWPEWVADATGKRTFTSDYGWQKIMINGDNTTFSKDTSNYYQFSIVGDEVSSSGDVQSMMGYAGTVKKYCYANLFKDCDLLTSAPVLSATSLAHGCYASMFYGCTSLTSAPALTADTLADYCYISMFYGCESLINPPDLKSTVLTKGCYQAMFRDCKSVVAAPELPAEELTTSCYNYMFQGCKSLSYVRTKQKSFMGCSGWLSGVSSTGMFDCDARLEITERGSSTVPEGWTIVQEYAGLKFTANTAGSTVKLMKVGSAPAVVMYTSNDGINWSTDPYVIGNEITLTQENPSVYFKAGSGGNVGLSNSMSAYHKFVIKGSVSASGNIQSLLSETMDAQISPYCYNSLFSGCSALTSAPELGATALAEYCYWKMFNGCGGITAAPELNAVTLATSCCGYMFAGCSALTTPKDLLCETLKDYCYANMFSDCISIETAPTLGAQQLAEGCYNSMFSGCKKLINAPVLQADELQMDCYDSMFSGCRSLVNAPELNASQLADFCYYGMFSDCEKLENPPTLEATTLKTFCYTSMFSGCTSLVNAPVLYATDLEDACYLEMFSGCDSLSYIKTYQKDFTGCDSWLPENNGEFHCTKELSAKITERSTSTVPDTWSIKEDV